MTTMGSDDASRAQDSSDGDSVDGDSINRETSYGPDAAARETTGPVGTGLSALGLG